MGIGKHEHGTHQKGVGGRYNWVSSMQFDAGWHYGYILSKDSKGNKWVKDQG